MHAEAALRKIYQFMTYRNSRAIVAVINKHLVQWISKSVLQSGNIFHCATGCAKLKSCHELPSQLCSSMITAIDIYAIPDVQRTTISRSSTLAATSGWRCSQGCAACSSRMYKCCGWYNASAIPMLVRLDCYCTVCRWTGCGASQVLRWSTRLQDNAVLARIGAVQCCPPGSSEWDALSTQKCSVTNQG